MKMIAERLIELEVVEAISDETVRLTLKENELKPWRQESWCIAEERKNHPGTGQLKHPRQSVIIQKIRIAVFGVFGERPNMLRLPLLIIWVY